MATARTGSQDQPIEADICPQQDSRQTSDTAVKPSYSTNPRFSITPAVSDEDSGSSGHLSVRNHSDSDSENTILRPRPARARAQRSISYQDHKRSKGTRKFRKSSRFSQSSGDMKLCCRICLNQKRYVVASGFCLDCQQNLCDSCLGIHPSIKPCRNHKLIGKPQNISVFDTVRGDISTVEKEPCLKHPSHDIEYYCPCHSDFSCTECVFSDHKDCELECILEELSKPETKEELETTRDEISEAITATLSLEKMANDIKINNDSNLQIALKEVDEFQKKINERIDYFKQQIIKMANKEKLKYDKHVDQLIEPIVSFKSEIVKLQEVMDEFQSENKTNPKSFTLMKDAQSKLNNFNIKLKERELNKQTLKCTFEPDESLAYIISLPIGLGKLSLSTLRDQI